MIAEFENYLRAQADISDNDIAAVVANAIPRKLQRNELLLQEGHVCRHKIFIVKGLLRTYGTAADGSEHILQFAQEHGWTLDVESYDKQTPAQLNIAAVEPSELLLWPKAEFDRLLTEVPPLQAYAQQLVSRNIYNSRQRILSTLSATPEEKYEDFVQAYPGLLPRLPLKMIASYLGVSIKTLTRIRHAQLRR